jgi:hypothetical protein
MNSKVVPTAEDEIEAEKVNMYKRYDKNAIKVDGEFMRGRE